MNPNTARLLTIRQLVAADPTDVDPLTAVVRELDESLSQGSPLPEPWKMMGGRS